MSESSSDRAVTGVTHDGAFRVIVLRTTETVAGVTAAQKVSGANAQHLGDVVTATVLVRLTMAPMLRVQGIVRGAGQRGTLVGDSHPDGHTRGLVQRPKNLAEVSLGKGAILQMMRTLPSGAVHQGVVDIPREGISGGLMGYFQASEQITSVAFVGSRWSEAGALEAAGGFIVQLLPEVSRAPLAIMTERLDADFGDRDAVLATIQRQPEALLSAILEGMPFEQTQEHSVAFGCHCSAVRVLSSLSTLPRADIRELMESEENLHITCDYCNETYEIPPQALKGLLTSS